MIRILTTKKKFQALSLTSIFCALTLCVSAVAADPAPESIEQPEAPEAVLAKDSNQKKSNAGGTFNAMEAEEGERVDNLINPPPVVINTPQPQAAATPLVPIKTIAPTTAATTETKAPRVAEAPVSKKNGRSARKPREQSTTERLQKLEAEVTILRKEAANSAQLARQSNGGAQPIASRSMSQYDPVPTEHRVSILRRLKLIEALIERHGRAYDYRLFTTPDLEAILKQLDGPQAPAARN